MPRRGQTALEYLMTYGWALLIIAIVAIALWKLGVFSPAAREGVARQPDPFFIDYRTVALTAGDNPNLTFTLANGAGATVTIHRVDVYEGGNLLASNTTDVDLGINDMVKYTITLSGQRYAPGDLHTFEIRITWEYYNSGVNRTARGVIAVRAA